MNGLRIRQWDLRLAGTKVEAQKAQPLAPRLPVKQDVLPIAVGNSGEEVGLRLRALEFADGYDLNLVGINNDQRAPNPRAVRALNGQTILLKLEERYVMGNEGSTRDRIKEYPLLLARYEKSGLTRGISVFESHNRGGHGGHAKPVITAMDCDLEIDALYAMLRKSLSWLANPAAQNDIPARSDIEQIIQRRTQQRRAAAQSWIIPVIGGGAGSCGNACHQLVPFLIRHVLAELNVKNYELWGIVLGPRAFTGLTSDTQRNYFALLTALEHAAQYGQQREYINGLKIRNAAPTYDRVWLLDDPFLPREKSVVTESELNGFFDRAAISLHLLMNTGAWQDLASDLANPVMETHATYDARIRHFNTASGALAGIDMDGLRDLLALKKQAQLLQTIALQLEG